MQGNTETYDLIVVGGGPAGMMAGGRAGECGASVLLLEKNAGLGKKLLISGGGRSNVTNAEFDTATLLKKYGAKAKFLHSPFSQFGVKETFDFFESRGMAIKIEAEKRAFPKSDTARSVLETLEGYMRESGVHIKTKSEVVEISKNKELFAITLADKSQYFARHIIISAGGLSHPETGSTGDGFRLLKKMGHDIQDGNSALVPIRTKESWGHSLSGLAFTDAKVTLRVDGKSVGGKQKNIGKILFTHEGLSGPLILNMSKTIGEALREGATTLHIDIFPKEDRRALDKRLRTLLDAHLNKQLRNVLRDFIPASLVPVSLAQNNIDPETPVNSLHREERRRLCAWWKTMPISPVALMGKDKAVVTSGGTPLEDIDMRTMESKKIKGLYVVGDMLDIDRPSGGYSLQLCWTTGWVAGTSAAK